MISIRYHKGALHLFDGDRDISPLIPELLETPWVWPGFLKTRIGRDLTAEEVSLWTDFWTSDIADTWRWWNWTAGIREGNKGWAVVKKEEA